MLAPIEIRGWRVKHQYVGDINDYRKYALLRALSAGGANCIGVCWMLTPPDGKTDGGKLAYLQQPKRFRHFDPELFDILAHAASEPDRRRLQTIEDSGSITGALYYNETLPQPVPERAAYMAECRERFADADLVFFDPDNGIEALTAKPGRRAALKYVFLDEIETFYGGGKSLLIYQHRRQGQFMGELITSKSGQLRTICPDAGIWTFSKDAVAFFLIVHPESPARLAIAAFEACGLLDPAFVRGVYLGCRHDAADN